MRRRLHGHGRPGGMPRRPAAPRAAWDSAPACRCPRRAGASAGVASRRADGKQMVDVPGSRSRGTRHPLDALSVQARASARRRPVSQGLRAAHAELPPAISSSLLFTPASSCGSASTARHCAACGPERRAPHRRDDRAGVAERGQVLRRVETEGATVAEGADRLIAVTWPGAPGSSLRSQEARGDGKRLQRVHVGRLTVEVDRETARHACRQTRLAGVDVDASASRHRHRR